MLDRIKHENPPIYLFVIGLAGWVVPGGGYYLLAEYRRAVIVFCAITVTFLLGLYVGSIGVIDPVASRPWYVAQIMNTPLVAVIGHIGAGGMYPSYGRPAELGQIYTGIAGLLNLLVIVKSVYLAHLRQEG